MKVNGPLEGAQLENIAEAAPSPSSTGRMYMDTTSPLSAKAKVFDGTSWRELAMTSVGGGYSQNSGKEALVDWANGLTQKLVLTDNCKISFANPVPGFTHTLVIQQGPADNFSGGKGRVFVHRFDMPDQATNSEPFQPPTTIPLGCSKTYAWGYMNEASKSYFKGSDLLFSTIIGTISGHMAMHPFGSMTVVASSASPYSSWTYINPLNSPRRNFSSQNLVAPTTAAGQTTGVDFAPNGGAVYYSLVATPFLQGFMTVLNNYANPGAGLTAPSPLPTGAANCVAVNPDGSHVAVGHATTPFMSIYECGGIGYGSKVANPSTLPANTVTNMAWSPFGDFLAVLTQTTPFLQVWEFDQLNGSFGTYVTPPVTLPAGGQTAGGHAVAWRPQGDFIAVGMSVSPFLYVIPFNRNTKAFGNPITVSVASTCRSVCWSPCGTFLLAVCPAAGDTKMFQLVSGNLVDIGWASSAPGANGYDAVSHPSGEFFFIGLTTVNNIAQYLWPRTQKNYVRLN